MNRWLHDASCMLFLFCCVLGCGKPEAAKEPALLVFAAASLRDVMVEVGERYTANTGMEVDFNFAGSNVLALQIRAAPVADVFLSADEQWMDSLATAKLLVPETRKVFLSNRLVVIRQRQGDWRLSQLGDLSELPFRFLAIADPKAVPAGRYARHALQEVKTLEGTVWDAVQSRLAPTADVRAALALVEAETQALGVVYRTDAMASSKVEILLEVAPGPEIRYEAAVIGERPYLDHARSFLSFLNTPEAQQIWLRHGFLSSEAAVGGEAR